MHHNCLMLISRFLFVLMGLVLVAPLSAQQVKAWVFYTKKELAPFDAINYFSADNIVRKHQQGLPLYDNRDLPVNEAYIQTIRTYCDSITFTSRWFNASCVYTNAQNLTTIESLDFVSHIELAETSLQPCLGKTHLSDLHQGEINLLNTQTQRMQAQLFRKNGITGKGITIAIIDAGFTGYKKNSSLKQVRLKNQIKYTYDFMRKQEDVDHGSSHGTAVLSCIAGKVDSVYLGLAPDAEFLLYRTEKAFNEKMVEEEYWLAAMEDADKRGAHIINTSLGYSNRRYFQRDMDGKKSLLARAANIASGKGILVVCSAGNEGDVDWKVICTPADADSSLAVGAINPWTGIQASWSSYGPSADLRIKPNVSAIGYVMACDGADGIENTLGTSFSSPLVAGFAACVRQLNTSTSAYDLLKKIEYSADLYPYYDYAHGFGVPLASRILEDSLLQPDSTFTVHLRNDSLIVEIIRNKFVPCFLPVAGYFRQKEDFKKQNDLFETLHHTSFHFKDENLSGVGSSYVYTQEPGFFYYHIRYNNDTFLREYDVLNVREPVLFKTKKTGEIRHFTFHYRGYTKTIAF